MDAYLAAIDRELSQLGQAREVDTLYFGGGTPTQLPVGKLNHLCNLVLQWHPLAKGYEWTVEANPADLNQERLDVLTGHGVNRISLGAQSFTDQHLATLERDHQAVDIRRCVERIKAANMHVAIDLIFGVPGQSLEEWRADLEMALKLQPDHISTYGLTFEKGTQFYNRLQCGDLTAIDEQLERDMYLLAIDAITSAGMEHYEVSNFALPARRSRHNQVYWSGDGYFAAGPGAARYVDGVRETNHRSTTTYLKRILAGESPVAERECLELEQRARELLVFSLRRLEGIEREKFQTKSGYELDQLVGRELEQFVTAGMLSDDGSTVKLTRKGLLVSDSLWPEIL